MLSKMEPSDETFRESAHSLEIEVGRYSNVPRENRLCKYCNLNVVESEYRFLLSCPNIMI